MEIIYFIKMLQNIILKIGVFFTLLTILTFFSVGSENNVIKLLTSFTKMYILYFTSNSIEAYEHGTNSTYII